MDVLLCVPIAGSRVYVLGDALNRTSVLRVCVTSSDTIDSYTPFTQIGAKARLRAKFTHFQQT